ncbi:MAG: FHA domain-containing protein [Anaerolineae bacterium]|nr:FHA domain-containing protein [Anaerolineae bacterium]
MSQASLHYNNRSIALNNQQITIGRHPQNSLYLEDPNVSRQHAVLVHQNGRWIVYDQGSSHGTYVNGQRLLKPHALKSGDRIQIGATVLVFQGQAQAQPWQQPTSFGAPPLHRANKFDLQHFWQSLTQNRKFSVSGTLLVLFCFFLPWTRLSCAGQTRDFSGYQMAAGLEGQSGITYLWLAPIAAITVLVLIYLRYSGRRQGPQASARWELGASGVGLLATLWLVISPPGVYHQAKQIGLEISLLLGYWGTLAGFLLAVWGSYKNYKEKG